MNVEGNAPRVLVLAESLPWPPVKGGDLRCWQNVRALVPGASVGVLGLCSNDSRRHRPPALPLAFWTATRDPALTYPPPSGTKLAARAWLLDPDGHPSDLFYSAIAADELSRLLSSFRPEVVVVEGLWLHRYLDLIRESGTRIVLDCYNVEAALAEEVAGAEHRPGLDGRVVRTELPARTAAIERAAVGKADQLWVCSDADARRLRERYAAAAPTIVAPNAVDLERHPGPGVRGRRSPDSLNLVYTGIYSYVPNAFAATFLVGQVMPRLRAACDGRCRLEFVGPMPTPTMHDAAGAHADIVVTGPVRDVRPHLASATAMPVPLFQGSGTRFKILEAFAAELPVVSTAKGAEGLDAVPGEHLLTAETAESFVDCLLRLWRERAVGDTLAANARRLVEERYSWAVVAPRLREALSGLAERAVKP